MLLQPESYWVVIPHNTLSDTKLNNTDKLVYAEISALTRNDGLCNATNKHFSKVMGSSERTISRSISKLEKLGYISVLETHEDETGKHGTWRSIRLNIGIDKNVHPGVDTDDVGGTTNLSTQKRNTQENISKDISKPSFGNENVNFAISEFKRVFGYSPSTQGQNPRQGAYTWIRMIQARIKGDVEDDKKNELTRMIITKELEWLVKQDWSSSIVGFKPVQTHLNKFIALNKNGKTS